jgi:hypothetical protein
MINILTNLKRYIEGKNPGPISIIARVVSIDELPESIYNLSLDHLGSSEGDNSVYDKFNTKFPYNVDPKLFYGSLPTINEFLFDLPVLDSTQVGPDLSSYVGKSVELKKTIVGGINKKVRFELGPFPDEGEEWKIVTEVPYSWYSKYISKSN